MAKRRIKKPVRKNKSDYPGEMSFRKALGMNPTYYQEGGKLYYQEDEGELPIVNYGSPEYKEAYNQGTLVRALPDDDIFVAKTLPEVTITAETPQWIKDKKTKTPDKIDFWESLNYKKWGLNDYSDYSSFNTAFRNAREAKEKEFAYKGERYNTNLIPKEESDLYWESKKFLSDYYKNNDYKIAETVRPYEIKEQYIKSKYGTTWREYYDQIKDSDDYIPGSKNFDKIRQRLDELSISNIDVDNDKNYKLFRDNYLKNKKEEQKQIELNNLEEPYYFSITNQKPISLAADGYLDGKNKKMFLTTNADPGKLNTTYIHELSHKADDISVYTRVPEIDLDYINKPENRKIYPLGKKQFEYLSDPSEIEARKMSLLFYAYKNNIDITKMNDSEFNKFYRDNFDKFPYDISQLFDLYSFQREDLLKYIKNDFSYLEKQKTKKQLGGTLRKFQYKNGGKLFYQQDNSRLPLNTKYKVPTSNTQKGYTINQGYKPVAESTRVNTKVPTKNPLIDAGVYYTNKPSNPVSPYVHSFLDYAGLVPGLGEPFDATNALLYEYEGDRENALISAAATIPYAGMYGPMSRQYKKLANLATQEGIQKGLDDKRGYKFGGKLYYQQDQGFIPDQYSESFKQAVRNQENSIRSGWNEVEKKWYPHKSVEGGTNTIAYGHKLNPKESYPKGLTEQEALKLFEKDFATHEKIAKDYVNEKFKKDVFSTLSRPKQLLLTDYAFNGVLKKFPSFATAIVEDNYDKMIKEYERYSGGKPLKSRNKWTKEYIDANFAPKKQIKNKRFGGKLRYARGGSLTSAQDTAQAVDLNQDVMRKDIKKASAGEDFLAGLYGAGAGVLRTIDPLGITKGITDAGFKALQASAGHDINSDEAKRQAGIAGWGKLGGATAGTLVMPDKVVKGAQVGLEGIGQGIQGINPSNQGLEVLGKGVEGLGNIKLPPGMAELSKSFMARNGGRFRYGYQGGGHMVNQNMGLTEIDGPSHEQGGVTLPNSGGRPDVEVEGPETIYTPENYVMSEKMKASKEALEYAGITGKAASRLAGKSYADLSKSIKSKAGDKLRPADPLSKKMLDKEMKRLMMAHEYDREAKRMKDEAMRSQMMGGSNVVAETPEERAGGYNMYPNAESIAFPGSGPTSVVPTYNNDPIMVTGADGSQQMLTDEPIETEAPFIEQKMAQGGKMIKRADGSYSRRGLWDNIRANRGSGRKPTKQMLEQEAKIKAAEKAYGGYYADGGSFDNPGFRALPDYVQAKIKSSMQLGGDMAGLDLGMEDSGMNMKGAGLMQGLSSFIQPITQTLNNIAETKSEENEYQMQLGGFMGDYIDEDDTMEYGSGGYTVRRSNDRKGKTHVVTGPDGTKKYFGDPKLGERGKSKYGKKAFYARHKKNLDKNPYFRAYARATWEDGGYMNMLDSNVDMVDMETPMYEYGGSMMYGQGGGIHIDPSKRGTFKAQASRMGMGVQQAARTILNAPEGKYSPAMRKKANFARNFAKADGGYMYQMGGEMMAQQPQGGGQEEIMQQVAQMLQQGMAPEEIVGQLVKMGLPQEQAIQIVQMIVQQMQGQQQAPQEAPQQAPPMMRGGGYMYQMGGEMAPQQAPQQGGSQEQIMQAIVEMLQQGLQPEQIVGELVKMGIPQEAAIQAVQMVMQQVQQSQGMQQQQAAPPFEQGMMGQQQAAPATMRGGGRMYQMGGSLDDNYLAQVNQYPVLKRGGGKLYYQELNSSIPNTTNTLENMLNDETIDPGVYQGADAVAIGDQANANINTNTNANTGVKPILLHRPSLRQRALFLGDVTAAGTMPSVNNRFNPKFTMTPQEKTNWLNKTKGYSGLLPDEGYAAINQFENTMGTYDDQGNPIGMGRGDQYAQTEDKDKIEAFIDSSIGRDTWDRLPDDVKTQAYSFMFNTGKYDAALSGLAQAINNSTGGKDLGDQRRGYSRDFSVNAIKGADFSNPYFYDKYLNVLGDQYNSIATNTDKYKSWPGANYAPTLRNRPISIHNNLYPATSSTSAQSATVVPQAPAAPSINQSKPGTGVLRLPDPGTDVTLNPTQIGLRNFNQARANAAQNNTLTGKPEKYQQWQPNTAPIVAGGLSAGITPIANLVASITGRDTRAAAPLKFEKPDYTPVAIQRAAANQALANTREALRRGAPTQGNYLSNLAITAPSLAANVGREIANKRFEIGKTIADIDMRQQLANDQNRKFNLMNQARDQAAREQLRLEAAKGFSTIGQGVTKDLGETLYEANILRNLETRDFSPFNYIKDEKGRFKQVLSPRGAALYRDNTTNNQIVTDNQDNKYMILPGGRIQLIQ
jgi:GH24 family phage-related lysozyme (muramidase)